MDEQLNEILGLDVSNLGIQSYRLVDINKAKTTIQALLATEYDRGKVDGAVEEAELVAKNAAYIKEHGTRNYTLKRVVENKGEVK